MAGNSYQWRTTKSALEEFYFLLGELNGFTEGTEDYDTLLEQIRMLPGFPIYSDEDDLVEIVTTDVTIH